MFYKIVLIADIIFCGIVLLMSDAVILAALAVLGTFITAFASIMNTILSKRIAAKQEVIHKQIDGQQEMLMAASKGQSKAEGKLETKDELIEVLKQTAPLEGDKPNDVIVKKNEDKLL